MTDYDMEQKQEDSKLKIEAREILFRSKPVDEKWWLENFERFSSMEEWAIGNLIVSDEGYWIVGGIADVDDEYIAHEWWVKVRPETVSQYTGLMDKNDAKIFEGDVVNMHQFLFDGSEHETEITGVIKQGDYGWTLSRIKNKEVNDYMGYENGEGETYLMNFYGLHDESFEVIGNKWDNPELLEVK